MTRRIWAVGLAASLLALTVVGAASARDRSPPRKPPADLSGIWTLGSLTELERPDDFKTLTISEAQAKAYEKAHRNQPPGYATDGDPTGGAQSEWWERDFGLARIRGQIRTSWIVSTADGKRPVTSASKAFGKAREDGRKVASDGPEARSRGERCIDTGAGAPLLNGGVNDLYQLVQTGDQLAIHAEWMDDVRVVRIGDTRHPAAQVRQISGDSIGRWEGATLVVESTNFSPMDVDDPRGNPLADMKTVERFTRLSPGELFYEVSVANPAVDTHPWQAEMVLHATPGRMYEFACHEGNYALEHILAGARHTEHAAERAAK